MITSRVGPRRALVDLYVFVTILVLMPVASLGLLFVSLFLYSGATADQISTIALALFIAFVVALLPVVYIPRTDRELACVILVRRWKKVTSRDANCFPLNAMECNALREGFFVNIIGWAARRATEHFKDRDLYGNEVGLLKQKHTIGEQLHAPEQLLDFRKRLAKKARELARIEHNYKVHERYADRFHREYLACWDLAEDIGEFYGVNLLPIDPETGKQYEKKDGKDVPTRYRESLESPTPSEAQATSSPLINLTT